MTAHDASVMHVQKALQRHQEGAEHVRLEWEAEQLKAQVLLERPRVAEVHRLVWQNIEECMDTDHEHLEEQKAEASQERLRAVRMQQESVRAQEAASRRKGELAEERARLTAQAQQERAGGTCVQQQLVQAQEAVRRLEREAGEGHAQLKAQAEEERARPHGWSSRF